MTEEEERQVAVKKRRRRVRVRKAAEEEVVGDGDGDAMKSSENKREIDPLDNEVQTNKHTCLRSLSMFCNYYV